MLISTTDFNIIRVIFHFDRLLIGKTCFEIVCDSSSMVLSSNFTFVDCKLNKTSTLCKFQLCLCIDKKLGLRLKFQLDVKT